MVLPLKGIIPPLVTPLLENGELDLHGLNNVIEHVLAGGVHGLFLLGTTGEGTSLSHKLRKQLIAETCYIVNKRVPVLACITDTSFEESLELAHYAAKSAVDALVIAAPYYLPISQIEMQDYLKALSPLLPLPFLLYNMPSCTKLNLSMETVSTARALGAIGIKDSSGNMEYMNQLLDNFGNDSSFSIITGSELFLPETLLNGGHGTVAGGANIFPRVFVDYYEASVTNDLAKIALLRKIIVQIDDTIYSVGENISKYIKGIKSSLSVLDLCNDFTAPPVQPFNAAQKTKIQTYMNDLVSHIESHQSNEL